MRCSKRGVPGWRARFSAGYRCAVGTLLLFGSALVYAEISATSPNHDHPQLEILAPGYTDLEYTPPEPGTYALPPLGLAGDGPVLDSGGKPARVHDFLGDKTVVLSFIYTRCNDVNGCPLASHVLRGVQNRLLEAPSLRGSVRLLSFSFDSEHDTPEVLKKYSGYFRKPGYDWQFLTCRTEGELGPILDQFDQWVIKDYDADGNALGTMSHLLRVFLIDRAKRIRNIYSVSFLHADTLLNDIRTLELEWAQQSALPDGLSMRRLPLKPERSRHSPGAVRVMSGGAPPNKFTLGFPSAVAQPLVEHFQQSLDAEPGPRGEKLDG